MTLWKKENSMNRRDVIQTLGFGAALGALKVAGAESGAAAQTYSKATKGLPPLKIEKVKTILTVPDRIRLCVVKVETSEPGLYGLGCATFTQRPLDRRRRSERVPRSLRQGPGRRWHRGSVAKRLHELLLAQWAGAEQRAYPAWTRPCGTSRANGPTCRCINCSGASAVSRCRATRIAPATISSSSRPA